MQNIKVLRKNNKLTQKDMAGILNITQPSYCDWENGKTRPSIEDLIKLADYFGVSVDYLIGRESEDGRVIIENGLSEKQRNLLNDFDSLPAPAQQKALGYIQGLADNSKSR